MRTFLCLDLGEKRIGAASGSLEALFSTPLESLLHKSRKIDVEKIRQMMIQLNVTDVVIGISLQEDGKPNSMGRHAMSFGGDLEKTTEIPVVYWDEALTTKDAQIIQIRDGASRKNRQGHHDSIAAAIILQSYFDHLSGQVQE